MLIIRFRWYHQCLSLKSDIPSQSRINKWTRNLLSPSVVKQLSTQGDETGGNEASLCHKLLLLTKGRKTNIIVTIITALQMDTMTQKRVISSLYYILSSPLNRSQILRDRQIALLINKSIHKVCSGSTFSNENWTHGYDCNVHNYFWKENWVRNGVRMWDNNVQTKYTSHTALLVTTTVLYFQRDPQCNHFLTPSLPPAPSNHHFSPLDNSDSLLTDLAAPYPFQPLPTTSHRSG